MWGHIVNSMSKGDNGISMYTGQCEMYHSAGKYSVPDSVKVQVLHVHYTTLLPDTQCGEGQLQPIYFVGLVQSVMQVLREGQLPPIYFVGLVQLVMQVLREGIYDE